jgi:predicted nucleic acid-binding Zn ribbon protein
MLGYLEIYRRSKMEQDKKSFTHIKDVIGNIFSTSALSIDFDDMEIWGLWDSAVGKKIAEHARPSSIKKGVLMVKVSDSIWLQELEFMAETIKEKLNSRIQRQAVNKIRFKVGKYQ